MSDIEVKTPKESLYSKFMGVLSSILAVVIMIFGFIGMIQELPNNISNETILLFVLGFGIVLVNRWKA